MKLKTLDLYYVSININLCSTKYIDNVDIPNIKNNLFNQNFYLLSKEMKKQEVLKELKDIYKVVFNE